MLKNYYIYKDNIEKPVAKVSIHETITEHTESMEIYNFDEAPFVLKLLAKNPNRPSNVAELFLEDRVIPSNRMFFAEQCKELGLNPESIDDRLTLSHGRTLDDDFYVETEFIKD